MVSTISSPYMKSAQKWYSTCLANTRLSLIPNTAKQLSHQKNKTKQKNPKQTQTTKTNKNQMKFRIGEQYMKTEF
jgi:hypothetical protein